MKTLIKVLGMSIMTLGMLAVVGIASASPADTLQPAGIITYNEEVVVNNTLKTNSAYIGSTAVGVGGVTFFNGTMINNSVDEDGNSTVPLTIGDDVRIDGRVHRGAIAGTSVGDNMPFIINDNVQITGTLTVAGLSGTGIVNSTNLLDGTVTTADIADNTVTSAKLMDSAVTSAKIVDGTIAGSDISSSADLSVDSISATGDVTQDANSDGIVKASFLFDASSDSIIRSFGTTISNIWPVVAGVHQITLDFSLSDRYFQITPYSTVDEPRFCTGGLWSSDTTGKTIEIRCYNSVTNTYAETDHIVTIY